MGGPTGTVAERLERRIDRTRAPGRSAWEHRRRNAKGQFA